MPRCVSCREKFIPKYRFQKYCMINDECIKHFAEQTKLKAWNEKKKKVKEDLLTVQDYLKLAQQVFNKYIRLRDKGNNCISCDKKALKENAGHMYSAGGHFNVRFDENNVHLQCEYCNTFLHGNLLKYRENLVKKIGYEAFEKLTVDSQLTRKFTVDELKQLIETYKQKIKDFT
jgi:hypothetical protein